MFAAAFIVSGLEVELLRVLHLINYLYSWHDSWAPWCGSTAALPWAIYGLPAPVTRKKARARPIPNATSRSPTLPLPSLRTVAVLLP